MKLSVIIVNYNVKSFLRQALISLESALNDIESEIWVVDNHSVDGSIAMLDSEFPSVNVIANKDNVGFSKANNQAIKLGKGQYVWVLNPDTLVENNTARILIDIMDKNPSIGMLGSKILNHDGSLQLACRRSIPTPWVAFTKLSGLASLFPKSKIFGRYNLTFLNPEDEYEVEAISGSNMFVRKSALDEVGVFDERFFMYGEDLDWCYRFTQASWKIVYTPKTQIIHYKGEASNAVKFDALTNFYHAMELFADKHYSRLSKGPLRLLLKMGIWFRYFSSLIGNLAKQSTLPILDAISLLSITLIAIYLKFLTFEVLNIYAFILPLYLLIWLISFGIIGLYQKSKISIGRIFTAITLGFLVNVSLTYFFKQYAFSRFVMAVSFAGSLFWIPISRFIYQKVSGKHRLEGEKSIVIGDETTANKIAQKIKDSFPFDYQIVGIVTPSKSIKSRNDPVLGHYEDIVELILLHRIEYLIFESDHLDLKWLFSILPTLTKMGVKIRLVPGNLSVIIGKSSVEELQQGQLIHMDYKYFHPLTQMGKRIEDLLLTIVLKCVLLFLFSNTRFKTDRWIEIKSKLNDVIRGEFNLIGLPKDMIQEFQGLNKSGLLSLEDITPNMNRNESERLALVNFYLKNQSIFLDLEIMLKAITG